MKIQLLPEVVCEVGVGQPSVSATQRFWGKTGVQCHLFEANPETCKLLKNKIDRNEYTNVTLYNCAIHDKNEKVKFRIHGDCSFVDSVESPVRQHDKKNGTKNSYELKEIEVDGVTFDTFDKGDIDLLMIDTEGSEWFCLKYLKSRPAMILVETCDPAYYKNTYFDEITEWMLLNDYMFLRQKGADSIFVKSILLPVCHRYGMNL